MGLMMNTARHGDHSGLQDTGPAEGNTQEPFLEATEGLFFFFLIPPNS